MQCKPLRCDQTMHTCLICNKPCTMQTMCTAQARALQCKASPPSPFPRCCVCRYVKTYGPEVNLFVDHSQVVQLECLRRGIWGTKSLWGRVLTYKGGGSDDAA
jgi:hypothetical protein